VARKKENLHHLTNLGEGKPLDRNLHEMMAHYIAGMESSAGC